MQWWLIVIVVGAAWFVWWSSRKEEIATAAAEQLEKDKLLYQHIKAGMREYHWREKQDLKSVLHKKDGDVIFETAHMVAYHVDHFAETRVGFHFKDLEEFGLYGGFAGNDDDFFESYYRSDSTFQKEDRLVYDE